MIFEKLIKIPSDRIGALIGKSGNVKSRIEETCSVDLEINGDTGEILIKGAADLDEISPFKAVEIVTAIGRGFSPENAMKLLTDGNILHVIDLREFGGKSQSQIERIKGRIIGEGGKARRTMEQLSDTTISVYGRTVSVIGNSNKLKLVVDAISLISQGSMHGSVYNKLESARRREKLEKLKLWENQDVF